MKFLLPRRLRFRLAIKQTLSFALLVMVLAWSAYALFAYRIYEQLDDELQDRVIAVRSMLQVRNGEVRWLNKEADREVRDQFERSIRYFDLLDDQGQVVESSRAMTSLQIPFDAAAQQSLHSDNAAYETFRLAGDARLRIINAPVTGLLQKRYVMRLAASMDQADRDCSQLRWFLLVLLPLVFVVHGITAWAIAKDTLRPLEAITAAAARLNPLDQGTRLPVFGSDDEFDQLSTTLNAAFARMHSSFQRMSDFLRNLSHEVRQPLTVMRAEAEQALRQSEPGHQYREMLSSQLQHVELLARTVSDLMEMAQSENDQIKLQCQTEDLAELVQAAVDGMRIKASEHNMQISGAVQQNVVGQFDAGQIWRLLLNLLENAIKYNRPDGKIDVSLTSHDGVAIVSVTDTGQGIPPEEQGRIFERGFRTQSARKSGVPGTGLGLHFARAIVEAHGGSIELTSVIGSGTCFRVTLPLAPNVHTPGADATSSLDSPVN
jgi:signal transduction histidine kinase